MSQKYDILFDRIMESAKPALAIVIIEQQRGGHVHFNIAGCVHLRGMPTGTL